MVGGGWVVLSDFSVKLELQAEQNSSFLLHTLYLLTDESILNIYLVKRMVRKVTQMFRVVTRIVRIMMVG